MGSRLIRSFREQATHDNLGGDGLVVGGHLRWDILVFVGTKILLGFVFLSSILNPPLLISGVGARCK